jgi:signal transduction histidine kinase
VRSLLRLARLRSEMDRSHALMREQRNALLQLQKQKEELVQLVVHDLRSPLSAILANTRYLQVGDVPDMQDTLSDIRIAAESILQQVTNLLDLNKAVEGRLVPRLAAVDICALLQQACGQVRRHVELRGQQLLLELEAGLAPVQADPELLRRVVQNLLDNCLKYTPPQSTVRVQARRRAGALELRVCDEGPGIPQEMRERVFEQRVRLEPSDSVSGYGLGLSFCRLAAEAHGGRIWVEDNEPTGSIFCLQLPERDVAGSTA